jgi:hypothetical protein
MPPLQTWQSSADPLQSLSRPSPHTSWSLSRTHAQIRPAYSFGSTHPQFAADGQSAVVVHARVQMPVDAVTATQRLDAQSFAW